jgi:hypothetical protein
MGTAFPVGSTTRRSPARAQAVPNVVLRRSLAGSSPPAITASPLVDPPQQILDHRLRPQPDLPPPSRPCRIEHVHHPLRSHRRNHPLPPPALGIRLHAIPLPLAEAQRKRRTLHLQPELVGPSQGEQIERTPGRPRLVHEIEAELGEQRRDSLLRPRLRRCSWAPRCPPGARQPTQVPNSASVTR